MKLRYKRSILGILWTLLNPLAQLLVFSFIFRIVLPIDIPNYTSFLFSGLLVWNWFQTSLLLATSSVVENRELIKHPGFPPAILPVVTIVSHLIHFFLAFPILLFCLVFEQIEFSMGMGMLPLVIAIQFALTLAFAYLTASVHVTFRDTQYLLGVVLFLAFYLTPVFYDASNAPERYQYLYQINPMVHLIDAYRTILIQGGMPDWLALLKLGVTAGVLLVLSYSMFRRASSRFIEEL